MTMMKIILASIVGTAISVAIFSGLWNIVGPVSSMLAGIVFVVAYATLLPVKWYT